MRITPPPALCLAWGVAVFLVSSLAAQPLEQQVKAAFLVNFAKFVEWPPAPPQKTFVIGVIGARDVAESLRELIRQGPVRGLPLEVREPASAAGFDGSILYLGRLARREDAVQAAGRKGLLLVGEQVNQKWPGLALSFFLKDRNVRFAAWPARAGVCGLTMSSKLLKVAQVNPE